jgi:hypothetical protein
VRYFSARDFSDALSPCAISFGADIVGVYHLLPLPGCRRDLVWVCGARDVRLIYPGDPDYPSDPEDEPVADAAADARPPRRPPEAPRGPRCPYQQLVFGHKLFVGCTPYTCSGTCDKAHAGADFDGFICRWAVPHFGQSPAGSVLNAVALCLLRQMALRNPAPGERRGASINTGNGVVWVHDFAFWIVVLAHALCAGLEGGCPICLRVKHLPHVERLDAEWQAFCARLGVPLSADKHQPSSQKPDYAGFVFDTVRGVVLCQPDKVVKLLACLAAWLEVTEITPRKLDSIQGRVLHYSYTIRYLRVAATQIYCLLGSVPEDLYDLPVPAGPEMRDLAREVVERFHAAGRPLGARAFLAAPSLP